MSSREWGLLLITSHGIQEPYDKRCPLTPIPEDVVAILVVPSSTVTSRHICNICHLVSLCLLKMKISVLHATVGFVLNDTPHSHRSGTSPRCKQYLKGNDLSFVKVEGLFPDWQCIYWTGYAHSLYHFYFCLHIYWFCMSGSFRIYLWFGTLDLPFLAVAPTIFSFYVLKSIVHGDYRHKNILNNIFEVTRAVRLRLSIISWNTSASAWRHV